MSAPIPREVSDEVRRLYRAGFSLARLQQHTAATYQQLRGVLKGLLRPKGTRPRKFCVECQRPAMKRHTNRHRKNPSGMRCRFHLRLYWLHQKQRKVGRPGWDRLENENG